jgi:hypothetical protein
MHLSTGGTAMDGISKKVSSPSTGQSSTSYLVSHSKVLRHQDIGGIISLAKVGVLFEGHLALEYPRWETWIYALDKSHIPGNGPTKKTCFAFAKCYSGSTGIASIPATSYHRKVPSEIFSRRFPGRGKCISFGSRVFHT